MSESVVKYVIQLKNGKFASFDQDDEDSVLVYNMENFVSADFLEENEAQQTFNELQNPQKWEYYGECLEPLRIRKVSITLEDS